ncbi:lytic transglycosylase domain-containing protein [Undibacterium sp. TS12]|uniref:lytic transglycosylase domain-containing protein n=1 Tax=Undibacterium sp. TS12 TaxID=2908202 RepID=UPI001F4D1506|nr:lytic transglycosylase domain-containing protein [Undibacterium sp. TS12]MCH8621975.1 lytic transglycosylase domain-containing protein [Undibacterium sp. TS12]
MYSQRQDRSGFLPRLFSFLLPALFACYVDPAMACWEEIGYKYGIDPRLLYAIARTESAMKPAALNRNSNGSYDLGLMQINSSWLPRLKSYGISERQLYEPCVNIEVAAWILANNFSRMGDHWQAVGAYNSTKPLQRWKYASKVYQHLP